LRRFKKTRWQTYHTAQQQRTFNRFEQVGG
jgi:hypothetical protein